MEARHIGRYRILEEVGSGGMAVVYKGIDTNLDREVAVKVLHPHLASREESRRRFSREARAVARLRHPNIVEIFDFSEGEARESFIVTEFVRGRTLRVFGDEVGFGLPEIAAMAAERLAAALEHAHDNGIVHRDLKPENVMVREDGELKLMDFGIARMIGGNERMTMTGALVGSPLHMAPEIIEGRDAGESADIFALGTILYWMVTGQLAFAGNNTTQTLRQILEGQYTDPRILAPACSDEIAELIGRCLRRDPAERPASMEAVRGELQVILASCGVDRIDEALRSYFLEPARYREELRQRLVEGLIASGEKALAEKRSARALALFNRVLALDEGNARVHTALERMKRSRLLRKRLRIGGAIVAGVLVAGGVALRVSSAPAPLPVPLPAPVRAAPKVEERASGEATAPKTEATVATEAKAEHVPPRTGAAVLPGPTPTPLPTPTPIPTPRAEAIPARAEPLPMQPVQIRWVPQGATLTIDGKPVATTAPAWSGELPAGKHTLALSHPACCQAWEEELTLAGGKEEVRRSIALAPRENGWFEVDCDLPGAEVWYEGTFKGTVGDVNARGGVPVAFSKDDSGRERYLKTVRFQVLPPRGRDDLAPASAEVTVRAGQKERSGPVRLETRDP